MRICSFKISKNMTASPFAREKIGNFVIKLAIQYFELKSHYEV